MVEYVDADWEALADAIDAERAELGWTQQDLADAARISLSAVRYLLNEYPFGRMPGSVKHVERALRDAGREWPRGTARRIVYEGHQPEAPPAGVPMDLVRALVILIRRARSEEEAAEILAESWPIQTQQGNSDKRSTG